MFRSEILKIAALRLKNILLVISLFVLLRGHNQPGGGFVAGLLTGSAFILHGLAFGPEITKKLTLMRPFLWMGLGLLMVVTSSLVAFTTESGSFLEGIWITLPVAGYDLKLGTPLLFDTGVWFAVSGVLMLISSSIMEEG